MLQIYCVKFKPDLISRLTERFKKQIPINSTIIVVVATCQQNNSYMLKLYKLNKSQKLQLSSHLCSSIAKQIDSEKLIEIRHVYQWIFSDIDFDRNRKINANDLWNTFQNIIQYFENKMPAPRSLSSNHSNIAEHEKLPIVRKKKNFTKIYNYFQLISNYYGNRVCLKRKLQIPSTLTYSECIQFVNQLESILKHEFNIKATYRIGLWMDNSFEYIISILAILKLGAIFVPLDVKHPPERLQLIEKESLLNIILVDTCALTVDHYIPASFHAPQVQVKVTERKNIEINILNTNRLLSTVQVKSVSTSEAGYIIFTSGSTGRPKGVLIEEVNLLNMIHSQIKSFAIRSSDIIAQFASICFDASLSEIFMTLLTGACLVIFDSTMDRIGTKFIDTLNQFFVTVITLPPSLLSRIDPQQVPCIRIVISAGEVCPKSLAQKWINHQRRFFNAYGPTEATVCSTIYEFDEKNQNLNTEDDTLPIGRLIDNLYARIVDTELNDVPSGVCGELLLGGIGVSRFGYINKEHNNAFFTWQQRRWYRTGDLVVAIEPDYKCFAYRGRKDAQIKFYGCRIELSEIETAIIRCSHVKYCVVVLHKCKDCKNQQGAIVAYVDCCGTIESIRKHISALLPTYMLPTYIIQTVITDLPVTYSGKINRQLLVEDKTIHLQHISDMSAVNNEGKLVDLWRIVFNEQFSQIEKEQLKRFTIAQLGGNSISIALLHSLINDQFSIDLPIDLHMTFDDTVLLISQHKNNNLDSCKSMINDLQIDLDSVHIKAPKTFSNEISTILLTGATGFLGSFLLYELLVATSINVLVPVRSNSIDEARNRLKSTLVKYGLFDSIIVQQAFTDEKIQRMKISLCEDFEDGNDSKFSFGFDDEQWNHIDAVLHCAANTNFNSTYNQLKRVNVLATKYFIQKCVHYSIPLYYISSLSIFLFPNHTDSIVPIHEFDTPHLQSVVGGYGQSKCIADLLVQKSFKRNLKGAIFRPGRITGSSKTGLGQDNDLFLLMLRGCFQLGAYPHLTFPFDITPVDLVSKSIINIIKFQNLSNQSYSLPIHLINARTLPFDEQFKLLTHLGCTTDRLEPLPYDLWLKKLIDRVRIENEYRLSTFNSLLPLIPFLQSNFWQNVHRWPTFERTHRNDAIVDQSPMELFKRYIPIWKRRGFF